jgi:hypothetical protein
MTTTNLTGALSALAGGVAATDDARRDVRAILVPEGGVVAGGAGCPTAGGRVGPTAMSAHAANVSVCRRCGRVWAGLAEAHCSGCHSHFGSVAAFDRHQRGATCHAPDERTPSGRPRCVWHVRRRLWVTQLDTRELGVSVDG